MTPSAISHDIERLEKDFGVTLIKRNRTGVELTEEGAQLRTKAQFILTFISSLKKKNSTATADKPEAVLRIAASHGLSMSLMPLVMARFKESHPQANMSLYTEMSREIVNQLLHSKLDIAVASNPKRVAALHMEPFRNSKLCALVPANHRLAKAKTITLPELAMMPLVIRTEKEGGSRTALLLKQMSQLDLKPNVAFRCGSPGAIRAAVRNGTGVGILVHDAMQDVAARKEFAILEIVGAKVASKSYILYAKKKPLSKTAAEFLNVLRAWRTRNPKTERNVERWQPPNKKTVQAWL